jgi:hypothetical protein
MNNGRFQMGRYKGTWCPTTNQLTFDSPSEIESIQMCRIFSDIYVAYVSLTREGFVQNQPSLWKPWKSMLRKFFINEKDLVNDVFFKFRISMPSEIPWVYTPNPRKRHKRDHCNAYGFSLCKHTNTELSQRIGLNFKNYDYEDILNSDSNPLILVSEFLMEPFEYWIKFTCTRSKCIVGIQHSKALTKKWDEMIRTIHLCANAVCTTLEEINYESILPTAEEEINERFHPYPHIPKPVLIDVPKTVDEVKSLIRSACIQFSF